MGKGLEFSLLLASSQLPLAFGILSFAATILFLNIHNRIAKEHSENQKKKMSECETMMAESLNSCLKTALSLALRLGSSYLWSKPAIRSEPLPMRLRQCPCLLRLARRKKGALAKK